MEMTKAPSANEILNDLVRKIVEENEFPHLMKKLFTIPIDIPMAKWSICNKLICLSRNYFDCRGHMQWQQVGRKVKAGFQKAVFILGPSIIKTRDKETGEELEKLIGWRRIMVFPYESTEGEELSYMRQIRESVNVSELPLIDVAKKLGIDIKPRPSGSYYGYFSPKEKEIGLCTDDEQTFLHEISHAVDNELGSYKTDDYDGGEIVAELSACFLASLLNRKADLHFTQEYLRRYVGEGKTTTQFASALFKYIDRVKAIYEFVHADQDSHDERQLGEGFPREEHLVS